MCPQSATVQRLPERKLAKLSRNSYDGGSFLNSDVFLSKIRYDTCRNTIEHLENFHRGILGVELKIKSNSRDGCMA